ncbi:YciI family protein [Aurantivibrio infirmus]
MLYSIVCQDSVDSLSKRKASRDDHLKRIRLLVDTGRIIVAGPNPNIDSNDPGSAGFSGSLIIAEFNDLEAAQKWAKDDPYVHAGVWKSVEVKPFIRVLP